MQIYRLFHSLRNPVFARLYAAQTTNLLGDALTWLGLALLAFEIAGKDSAVVLSGALTLRVTAFVLLSPFAGMLADRLAFPQSVGVPILRLNRAEAGQESLANCLRLPVKV